MKPNNKTGSFEMKGMFADVFFNLQVRHYKALFNPCSLQPSLQPSLQEIMNFTFTLTQPPDGQWGAEKDDGINWTGMVGMLQHGELDIGPKNNNAPLFPISISSLSVVPAATDFTVTVERSAVMTFAEPITQIYHSLFIKNPAGTPNYTAYVEPLHWMTWMVVAILIVLTPPLLFMAVRYVLLRAGT